MKILVTGGAGFIGSHTIVELVEAGFEPIVLDNFQNSERSVLEGIEQICERRIKVYAIDCTDSDALDAVFLQEGDIGGVIHFAADKAVGESVNHPIRYYQNNLVSLLSLLQVMAERDVHNLVFSSSCTVYGQPETLPVTEQTPVQPALSPYGNTKQICEEIIRDTVASGATLQALSLRYFNPIGAHPSALIGELPLGVPNNLIPFITQTAAGLRQQLSIYGHDYSTPDGTCIRDYIHVVDLAKAHVRALTYLGELDKENHYDTINLGTGRGASVLEVVNTFEKATGVKLNYRLTERRPGDIEQIWASVDKATHLLNWKTELSLEQGLKDAWRWQQRLQNSAAH
jgi:UDP-glucose 4-epimerase